MKVIGITGSSGSGKGLLRHLLDKRGISTYDADSVYHSLIESDSECCREIKKEFGNDVINANGGVDRRALAKIVFGNDADATLRRNTLNAITHKYVINELKSIIRKHKIDNTPCIAIEVPLLFESGFYRFCDVNIAVIAPKESRIERIVSRDNISADTARLRVDSQPCDDFYIDRSHFVMYNNANVSYLEKQLEDFSVFMKFNHGIEI